MVKSMKKPNYQNNFLNMFANNTIAKCVPCTFILRCNISVLNLYTYMDLIHFYLRTLFSDENICISIKCKITLKLKNILLIYVVKNPIVFPYKYT